MQARDEQQSQQAGTELARYLARLVADQIREPGNGVIGRLVPHVHAGEITEDELAQLSMVLLIAGLETTSSMIPLGVITLLEHPGQLAALRSGDGVVVSSTMVNRDSSVHADPHVLDASRGNRHHLTFGYGIHQCLGQNLARLQLQLAYRTLFERIPGLRLTIAAEDIRMRTTGTMQGVERLPVAW